MRGMKKESLERGITLFRTKSYEQAVTEFLSTGIDPSENSELSYYLGFCYVKLEKYDDALLYLEQVVTLNRNIYHVYQCRMLLSYIYAISGRYRLASLNSGADEQGLRISPSLHCSIFAYFLSKIEESLAYLEKPLRWSQKIQCP